MTDALKEAAERLARRICSKQGHISWVFAAGLIESDLTAARNEAFEKAAVLIDHDTVTGNGKSFARLIRALKVPS